MGEPRLKAVGDGSPPPGGAHTGRTPPEVVSALAARLVQRVSPLQVILFGSYARGDTHERSDVDFLLVLPEGSDREQARRLAYQAIDGSPVEADVVVATVDEVRRYAGLVGMVYRPALREGLVLYDAASRQPWRCKPAASEPRGEAVTEEDRLAQTRAWLAQAQIDLRAARGGLTVEFAAPGPAGYLAQQAAEKALKAVLVFLQTDYPITHNLDTVRNAIPTGWALKDEFPNLRWLSDWVFRGRYPSSGEPPEMEEAREAVALAQRILDSVARDLAERGMEFH